MESLKCSWLVFVLLVAVGVSWSPAYARELQCDTNTISCNIDGVLECLDPSWLCDDFPDCDEGEDEAPARCKGAAAMPATPAAPIREEDDEENAKPETTTLAPEVSEDCLLKTCNPGHQLSYVSGRLYRYSYRVDAATQVLGTSDKVSNFSVDVKVVLNVYSACELSVKIEDAKLTASTSGDGETIITENEFLDDLKANELRFAMDNGLVDTVCPRRGESLASLNFKRGLLALLQNSMPRYDLSHSARESDVLGTCDIVYKFSGTNDTAIVIDKNKDVDSCTGEFDVSSSVKGVPYAFVGGYQAAPVFSTSSSCRQNIADRRLKTVQCTEERKLVPFSTDEGGVISTVRQYLELQYASFGSTQTGAIYRRTKLEYDFSDHEGPRESESGEEESAVEDVQVESVKAILSAIGDHLKVTRSSVATPADFSKLIRALRTLKASQLIHLTDSTDWGKNWLVFQDAVPAVGTAASVALIHHILGSRPNFERAEEWLRSLAYIPRPDLETLDEASGLLKIPTVKPEVFLGVGALVNSYCTHHRDCAAHQQVRNIVDLLQGFIQDSCARSTSQEKLQTLLAIKGLGNAGSAATHQTVELLRACVTAHEPAYNEDEIRVAAVNAFRRFQCNLTEPLNEFFKDPREDSEVRIWSYLGLMRCADYDTLASVLSVLQNEEVNQVGSFIWTHLTNIQEGSLPSRISVQGLLSNQMLQEKFRTDVRKFSRNYEWSVFYDPLNIGGGIEGNVVFSQKSYIPRSATLNFTTDLFGQSINWLQLETRLEGFERPLENMFMGTMPNPVPANDGIPDTNVRTLIERTGAADAYRRKQPELSVAMKTFGNDVFFDHLHGAGPIREALAKLNPARVVERLNKGETLSLQKSVRPIESEGRVATSAGLPVSVALTGTVSFDLLARATIGFGSLYPTNFNPSIDIRGTLTPSVASEISATVKLEGMGAVAGVEVAAAMSSSSSLSGRLNANGLSTFNLDLSMSSEKIEFINVTSNLFLIHGSASHGEKEPLIDEEALDSIETVETQACTPYSAEIGAHACWALKFPNTSSVEGSPSFPLTGPAHLQVIVTKEDPQLRTYQIRYSFSNDYGDSRLLISANTPGTSVDREHSVFAALNTAQQTADLRVHTPRGQFDAKGRYVWEDLVKKLDMVCQVDGQVAAELELSLTRHQKTGRQNFIPVAKIKWKGRDLLNLGGSIEALEKEGSRIYSLDLQFSANTITPTDTNQIQGEVHGEIKEEPNEKSINLDIDYQITGVKHRATVEYSLMNTSDDEDWKFVSECEVTFTQFPTLNWAWGNSYRMKPGSVEMNVKLNFGENFRNDDHAVHFHRSLTFLHSDEQTVINSTLALRHGMRNIDVKVSGDFSSDWEHVANAGFLFQLASGRDVSARLELRQAPTPLLDGSGLFKLRIPSFPEIQVDVKVNETSRRSYDIEAKGSAGVGREVEVQGTYQTNLLWSHHKLVMDLRMPDHTVTNVNASALLTWEDASIAVEVRPDGESVYRGVVRYTHNIDQLDVSTQSLDVDVNFPGRTVKVTTGVSVGRTVTVINRIQFDRRQDIVTRLVFDILELQKQGAQLQVQWDPNRDPLKKFDVSLRRDWSDPAFSSVNASAFLGLLGNTYQMSWASTALKVYSGDALHWEQRHSCRLQWEDKQTRARQQVDALAHVRLTRDDTAELVANFQISTPFEQWRDNYFRVQYLRNSDRITSTVKSRWHDHEFFDAKMIAEKSYQNLRLFSANSSLDISSSFQGIASLRTGATVNRRSGLLESNAFIQWEEDRVEVRLEGHDQSTPGLLDYSIFGHAITSLEGYRSLSSELNFAASSNNINAKAAAHWDALSYELKCRGNRYTGDDYLNGEISLLLPGYEQDDFYGHLKLYKDPVDQRHRLLAAGNWGGKAARVEGHVTSERQDFHSGLSITTPFEGLPHALLVLGKGFDGINHKSEARIAWGDKFTVGFELLGHLTSITDFLVSLAVITPVQRFREVKAELRHLFHIGDEVRCHSRIFGQVGDKKYGIGGRYEQGQKPRFRVAFEAYTPLPRLEQLSLDLSDNSVNRDSEYELKVLYGSNSPLHLTVGVVRGQDEEDWAVKAELPFSILDSELQDVEIDLVAGMNWGAVPRLALSLLTDTGSRRKVVFKTMRPPYGISSLEASIGGFVTYPGYEEVSLVSQFAKPTYDNPGTLEVTFRTNGAGITTLSAKGDYRSLDATFSSPIEPFRMGEVKWRSVPTSVVQEKVSGSFRWETDAVTLEGTAHVRGGSLTRLEAEISTPWPSFESCRLTMDNSPTDHGVGSYITLTGLYDTIEADVSYDKDPDMKWEINSRVNHTHKKSSSFYKSDIAYQFDSEKLLFSVEAATPLPFLNTVAGSIDFKYPGPAYSGLVKWNTSLGSGRLEMEVERNHLSRSIISSSTLTLQTPGNEDSNTYGLKVDLDNRSTDEKVDLDVSIELTSSHDNWDEIKVSGTVRQVTQDPGEVRLSLTWPKLAPVTFVATASHQRGLTIIKPSVSIEIESTKYGVSAEWETRERGEVRILKLVAGMYNEGQAPIEVQVDSTFNVYLNTVEGTASVKLPLAAPWQLSTATIEYNKDNDEHKFHVQITTGGHEIDIEGMVASRPGDQVSGTLSLSSSLLWNKHPLEVSFKQSLTSERYTGEYKVDFPLHNKATDTWTRGAVEASLVHSFLAAGHKGLLTVHPAFLKLEPITLSYMFEFPNSQDMTVQVKLSYKAIELGIKIEELVVTQQDGSYRRRFTTELENPLWPFGLASYKNVQPDRKHETVLEIYDLKISERKMSLSFVSDRADGGRKFTITMDLPGGRVVTVSTGYRWSDVLVELLFHFSWLEDQSLDFGFKWEDISSSEAKQHRIRAHVTHPFREVVLEADYSRRGVTVDADLTFNWNALNSLNDVLRGKLQWQDLSASGDQHYNGLLRIQHPSLAQDITTNVVLRRNRHNPILMELSVLYDEDATRDLFLGFNVTDENSPSSRKQYLASVTAKHAHSNLSLEAFSSLTYGGGQYGYSQQIFYTNSSGNELDSTLVTVLDLHEKTLRLQISGVEREIDLTLVVEDEGNGKWRVKAVNDQNEALPVTGLVEIHPLHPLVSVTVENSGSVNDHFDSRTGMLKKKMMVRGGVEDMRNAVFSMSHIETIIEEPSFPSFNLRNSSTKPSEALVTDVNFYLRLNNTRLISSSLDWRPDLKEEIRSEMAELSGISHAYRSSAADWLKAALRAAVAEAAVRAKPILVDVVSASRPLLAHFKNQTKEFLVDARKIYTTMNLTTAEIRRRDSLKFIFSSFSNYIKTTKLYMWVQQRLAGGGLRTRVSALLQRVMETVQQFISELRESGGLQRLKAALAETYDKLAKRWYLKLSQVLGDFRMRLRTWLRSRWHTVYHNYKPHIITTLNNIETSFNQFVRTVSGTISMLKESLTSSPYYKFITDYVTGAKEFLMSVIKKPLRENLENALDWIERVVHKTIDFLLTEIAPFLQDWLQALEEAWRSLEQYPLVLELKHKLHAFLEAVIWSVRNVEFRKIFLDVVSFSFENGYTILTQSALDAEHRQRRVKTHLYLDAEKGHLEFVQKLPMPWDNFNLMPRWEDLKEWRFINLVQTVLSGGKPIPVLDIWYKYYSLSTDPRSWIPPFEASSEVVGQQHLVTWNGRLLKFRGLCRYLLAADLMSSRWAVVLNYHAHAPNAYIVYLDGKQVELEQQFVVKVDGRPSQLPTVLPNTVVFRSGQELILRQTSGLHIRWNQLHDVFVITLPGIYFNKVGGLLGTNNYESLDDMLSPTGYLTTDLDYLASTWSVSMGDCETRTNTALSAPLARSERCDSLFKWRSSPFKFCFYQVSPNAYEAMCRTYRAGASELERLGASCAAASAFRQACSVAGVPTKIPHDCNSCKFEKVDGSVGTVSESQMTVIPVEDLPSSTDVVILVEIGHCNNDANIKRNLRRFFQSVEREMSLGGITGSRYTVVAYGGRNFFASPQVMVTGSDLFSSIDDALDTLLSVDYDTTVGSGRDQVDAFEALRYAANLPFRAGIVPTFFMMPCTACFPDVGILDFATMYHILTDRGVVLHILTPGSLAVSKESLDSKILGMDEETVYTVKDARSGGRAVGDRTLRRQVGDPRQDLEYCSPLALQTNGTIFTSRWLKSPRRRKVEQVAVVLGRRAAVTAVPRHNQRCICLPTADDSVKMKCHRIRPEWGNFSVVAPYFGEEGGEDYLDTLEDLGYAT